MVIFQNMCEFVERFVLLLSPEWKRAPVQGEINQEITFLFISQVIIGFIVFPLSFAMLTSFFVAFSIYSNVFCSFQIRK